MRKGLLRCGLAVTAALALAPSALPQSDGRLTHQPNWHAGRKLSQAEQRRIEMLTEIDWLADALTFPYALQARMARGWLEVHGSVPDRTVRDHAWLIAHRHHPAVKISLSVNSKLQPRDYKTSVEQLERAAATALERTLPHLPPHFTIQGDAEGRLTISGCVASEEARWVVSQTLSTVPGCCGVVNHLDVGSAPTWSGGSVVMKESPLPPPVVAAARFVPPAVAPAAPVKLAPPVETTAPPRETTALKRAEGPPLPPLDAPKRAPPPSPPATPIARPALAQLNDAIRAATWSTSQTTPIAQPVMPAHFVSPPEPTPLLKAPPPVLPAPPVLPPGRIPPPWREANAAPYLRPLLAEETRPIPEAISVTQIEKPPAVQRLHPTGTAHVTTLPQQPTPRAKPSAKRQPSLLPSKPELRSGVSTLRPPSATRHPAVPEHPYVTHGVVVVAEPMMPPSPCVAADLAAVLKQRIQALCGDAARVQQVTFLSASKLLIEVEFLNSADRQSLARQIVSLPELQAYEPLIQPYLR